MKRRHHMTEQERHQLEAMRRNKIPVREISRQLGFCERTIYYELRRGRYLHTCDFWDETRYSAQKGQQVHNYNQTAKGRPLKIGNDHAFATYIEQMPVPGISVCVKNFQLFSKSILIDDNKSLIGTAAPPL